MSAPLLHRWLLISEWRHHPLRMLIAILAIAMGVALGYAIDLVNSAASKEFSAALQSLSGQSDLQVKGGSTQFDEKIYPLLAQHPAVENAYPVLEIDLPVPGKRERLKILGVDALRAGRADLIGQGSNLQDSLGDNTIYLSNAAKSWLGLGDGQFIELQGQRWRIAGGVLNARPGQRIAIMDIAAAQWRLQRLGQLSRIELRINPRLESAAVQQQLQTLLQQHGTFSVTRIEQQEQQAASMTRAYRVNLTMLALIALLTGAFLVFTNMALSVIRRRSQFALFRVLGLTRGQLILQIVLEGSLPGILGSLGGIALGYTLAHYGLQSFGADLGAGYFAAVTPRLQFEPLSALLFMSLGVGVALAGSLTPAWQASRQSANASLKAEDASLGEPAPLWPALTALLLALPASQLPPVAGLPVFAYIGIALMIVGTLLLMPPIGARLFAKALQWQRPHPLHTLALARLANHPGQAGIALGGLLTSFSLMVAMAIMVTSFRVSLDNWLQQILPADLYVRSEIAPINPAEQQALAQLRGIARVDWQRWQNLSLDPARPPVALLARTPPHGDIVSNSITPPKGSTLVPIWISEAMPDLYGYQVGQQITLPLGGRMQTCLIVGIWRDYARQFGSIIIDRKQYQTLTGDNDANDGAIHFAGGASAANIIDGIKSLPFGSKLELAEPGQIRAFSLRIFDRSFAITYLLEAIAVLIGLFGIASSFSAQTLARKREFGMLRHLGYGRGQILRLLALEGGWLGLLGISCGFALGYGISLILVFIINPQSFHWRMDLAVPWQLLGSIAIGLWLASAATALLAGRHAIGTSALTAVKEDW